MEQKQALNPPQPFCHSDAPPLWGGATNQSVLAQNSVPEHSLPLMMHWISWTSWNDAVMIKVDSDCIWELKHRVNTTAEGCRRSCILVVRPRGTSWGSLSSGEKSQPWLLSAPRWQVLYCISTLYTLELSKELRHGNKGSQENSHCDYGKNPLKLRPQQGSK